MGKMYSNPSSPCGGDHLILLNHKIFSESHSKYCVPVWIGLKAASAFVLSRFTFFFFFQPQHLTFSL